MEAAVLDLPDCLACGACCFSHLETYVRVSGDDHARLAAAADELTRFIGNRCYLRLVDGHCAALQIDREHRQFRCSVYELRPDTCRDLERGSPACLGERATKGDRPLVAMRSSSRRRSP